MHDTSSPDPELKFFCDSCRHIVCIPYSIQNLHTMASVLGLKRCWFHKDHYDMPKKRIEELTARCALVSSRDIVHIIRGTYA